MSFFSFELLPRVELGTSSLPRMRSTTELKQQRLITFLHLALKRAEDGAQTRDPQLGRLVLYRLSYFRIFFNKMWVVMDSNHRRRAPADLQSAPFGHSGNHPSCVFFSATPGMLSLLSDSNQRPRDYKSRALAN